MLTRAQLSLEIVPGSRASCTAHAERPLRAALRQAGLVTLDIDGHPMRDDIWAAFVTIETPACVATLRKELSQKLEWVGVSITSWRGFCNTLL